MYDDDAMNTFLARVQQRSGLETFAEADALANATLAALAESISSGQLSELAEGLPDRLREAARGSSGQARAFDKTSFLDKVSGQLETVDAEETERQVTAALQTIGEWAPAGETADAMAQLPGDLARMFEHP